MVFHDLPWPGRRYANIDHVVVGPHGVLMIDSKNWPGAVTVRGGVLRLNRRAKEREVAAAADAALALRGLVPSLHEDLVRPVLCFVQDEPLQGWAGEVMVCSTSNLLTMLTTRPKRVPADQLVQLCLDLESGIRARRPCRRSSARYGDPWPTARRRPGTSSRCWSRWSSWASSSSGRM